MDRRRIAWLVGVGLLSALGMKNIIEARNPSPVATTRPPSPPEGSKCRGYKGEAFALSAQIKNMMRNPPSFEHVSTEWGAFKNGRAVVVMTYRATNGFGGVDTAAATGEVRASDCAARVLTI